MYARQKKLKFMRYVYDVLQEMDIGADEPYVSYKKELLRQVETKIRRLETAINTYRGRFAKGKAHEETQAQNPDS